MATSKANAEAGQRMLGNTMESIGRITRAFFESKSTKRDASVLSDLHQKRTRIDKNCKRSCLDPSQEDEDDNSDASSIFSMTTIAEEEDVPKTGHDLPIPFSPSRTLQLCNSWIYIHQSLFHLQEEHREALSILSQTKLGKRVIHGLDSVVEKLLDCAQPIQEGLVFLLDPEATGSKNLRQNLLEMRA